MEFEKHTRITGPDRAVIGAQIANRYEDGESIRAIAKSIDRSFGFVHRLLVEQETQMRSRGGNHRR